MLTSSTVPPQTLLIKTCEGLPFPAFWGANHGVLIATVQATFFNVNAKEKEKKRRKEDQQLSSGIKVYSENSLNVGFEFMLIMITLLFHAKLCFIKNEFYKECAVRFSAIFFSLKRFLFNREFYQTLRTILQPSFNGLIVAASGPLVCWRPSLLLMFIYNVKRTRVVVFLIHDITLHPPFIEVVGLSNLTGLISPQFQLRVRVTNKSLTFLLSDPPL